jgi:hypothetical protein
LKWILKKEDEKVWTGFHWLRIRQVAGYCEHGNEPPGSSSVSEKFLDQVNAY